MKYPISVRPAVVLSSSLLIVLGACASPTGADAPANGFTAVVRGSVTASLAGSASVSTAGDHAISVGFKLPAGTPGTIILLIDTEHNHFISLVREGSLSPGTYPLRGQPRLNDTASTPFLYASYAQLLTAGERSFLADSGSVTITSVGSAVRGSFILYASNFTVWPLLSSPPQPGLIVTPLAYGSAPLQVAGSFEAAFK